MTRNRSNLWLLATLALSLALLVSCGGDGDGTEESSDAQSPTVAINAPANQAILPAGQPIPVSVVANDDEAISRIELYVDNSLIESRVTPSGSALTTITEQFNWSASIIGPHTLQARAYDATGQMGASVMITVDVQLPGGQPTATAGGNGGEPTPPPAETTQPPPTEALASPTPEPAQVTANVNANVRSGPGTNYPVVGGLAEGQSAPVTGRNADSSWWQISYEGSSAWIANSVATANAQAATAPVVSAPPPPPTNTPAPPTATATSAAPTGTPAPTTGLWADQTNLTAGQCTTLHWNFTDIQAFYISLGAGYDKGGQPGTGSRQVCPSVTTEYKTTVVKPGGSQEFPSLTINVTGSGCGDPVIQRFVPTTDNVMPGQPFSIFWDVECAKSVRFVRVGISEEPVGGHASKIDEKINNDTVYQLKVERNSGGFVYASFEVEVP